MARRDNPAGATKGILDAMISNTRKVAVILNKNARRYTRRLVGDIARIIPRRHVWATGSLAEAQSAVREILKGGFDVIFTGGGDGTIVTALSVIRDVVGAGGSLTVPPVGILKLGTGNAWTYAVGVKGGLGQLAHVTRGGAFSTVANPLIEVGGLLCPFAGMGWDAQILNDYYDLNKEHEGRLLSPFTKNLFGYFLAAATKTLPRFAGGANVPEVEVTCTGGRLFRPDRNGDCVPVTGRRNAILYHGPASYIAAGVIPFFGYKLRAFPHAGKVPGTMHLRIVNLDPGVAVRHLRGFWKGTYHSNDIIDFLTDGIRITSADEQPIEVGGDPMGYTRSVEFTISDYVATIIDFEGRP
jgi:diacylglycerol kinase family enzyme